MDLTMAPTKSNLMLAKNSLALSKQGYELLDKKRNLLIREMMLLVDKAKVIQSQIETTFTAAYAALQRVNIKAGIEKVDQLANSIPIEDSINIRFRSIMGVELPIVTSDESDSIPQYGFYKTSSSLDEAYEKFNKAKELTIKLAEIENAVYRLAINIKKTQKRANALKNSAIPKYEVLVKEIQNSLEEKEREEFTTLKVIKKQSNKNNS